MNLNGVNYSFGPNGWDRSSAADYASRQGSIRSGNGLTLNLTANQEAALASCVANGDPRYSANNNNCSRSIMSCLQDAIGQTNSNLNSIFPISAFRALSTSGWVAGQTAYGSGHPNGICGN